MAQKLLLFDIDGTLLSCHAGKIAISLGLADAFAIQDDLTGIELAGKTDAAIARQIFAKHQIEPTAENLTKLYDAYLNRLPSELPNHPSVVHVGIPALMEALKSRPEFIVALLTGNLSRGAEIKLTHFGLWSHFEFGAFADDHHLRNELGRFAITRAQEKRGITFPPERIYILGDTPHDIACARAIGAKAVAIATGQFTREQLAAYEPDILFDDLSDTEAVLAQLAAD